MVDWWNRLDRFVPEGIARCRSNQRSGTRNCALSAPDTAVGTCAVSAGPARKRLTGKTNLMCFLNQRTGFENLSSVSIAKYIWFFSRGSGLPLNKLHRISEKHITHLQNVVVIRGKIVLFSLDIGIHHYNLPGRPLTFSWSYDKWPSKCRIEKHTLYEDARKDIKSNPGSGCMVYVMMISTTAMKFEVIKKHRYDSASPAWKVLGSI